jgi:hypothetical protein
VTVAASKTSVPELPAWLRHLTSPVGVGLFIVADFLFAWLWMRQGRQAPEVILVCATTYAALAFVAMVTSRRRR